MARQPRAYLVDIAGLRPFGFAMTQDAIDAAADRVKRALQNRQSGDVCWASRVYDSLWTEKPVNSSFSNDLEIVAAAYIREREQK